MAAGQAELFDGVHLPDRVGFRGPVAGAGGFAAGGRRGLPVAPEAALQGPSAGEVGEFGMEVAQAQPQIGCPPGRMLFVQEQGLLESWGEYRREPTRIGREQRRLALAVKRPAQAADGARRQLQPLGNDSGRLLLLPQREDLLPLRERKGCRHSNS